ncbi:MAG: ATP-binding protein [Chloroflexi bacterium]|nr:ATP-binding protein [Chloroflexota bacterium]
MVLMDVVSQPCLHEAVESLSDSLAEAANYQHCLNAGMDFVLSYTGLKGAAVYINAPELDGSRGWTTRNLGSEWIERLQDPQGLLQQSVDRVSLSGMPLPGTPGSGIAAILPLSTRTGTEGALLLSGSPCNLEEAQSWTTLVRPIARQVHALRLQASQTELSKEIDAMKILAASLSEEHRFNDVQLWVLKGITTLFKCDAATLFLLDDGEQEMVIKKTFSDGSAWASREDLKLEDSLVLDCIRSEIPIYVEDADLSTDFNLDMDGIDGIKAQSVFFAPLISNAQVLGAVEVINSSPTPLGAYELSLLPAMAQWLANSIFNLHLIQQLKITNADLEANRWELLRSRNTLRALFDSIPASFYIIDHKHTIMAVNLSRAERSGSQPNLLVGKKCYEQFHQRVDPCPGCKAAETFMNGRITTRVERQWQNNDQPVEWEISTFPIQDGSSLPVQVILLEQDITEKRRLEANLIQTEKLAAVGQLAAGVAHEINNPLSAIIANAQLLLRDLPKDNLDAQESVKLIELAGRRASQVVRDLLGFARKEQFNFAPTDVNETIHNALALLQHELIARPITVKLDLDESLPQLPASRDHLQGVWINMVINALDAMDGRPGEISISTRLVSNEIRITIADNGKGINPERVMRIFEPFYTTKASGRGTGLGLSVCHRIVKQHGGYIQVESQVDVGTKFIIVLPANPL